MAEYKQRKDVAEMDLVDSATLSELLWTIFWPLAIIRPSP
jgi:hypothetical protein